MNNQLKGKHFIVLIELKIHITHFKVKIHFASTVIYIFDFSDFNSIAFKSDMQYKILLIIYQWV